MNDDYEPCEHAAPDENGVAPNRQHVWGVEIQGVYDGILYWDCATCDVQWPRFQPDPITGYASLNERAKAAIEIRRQAKRDRDLVLGVSND